GTHGMPTTVLHIPDASKIKKPTAEELEERAGGAKAAIAANSPDGKKSDKDDEPEDAKKAAPEEAKKAEKAAEAVKEAAEQIKRKQKKEEKVDVPDVTTIVHEAPSADVIAQEAEKGYDIMFIGVDKTLKRDTEFAESVETLALGFDKPLGLSVT